jgi:hypothetical protein
MTSGPRDSCWLKETNPLLSIPSDYGVEQIAVIRVVHARFVPGAIKVKGWHIKGGPVEVGRGIEVVVNEGGRRGAG